MTTVFRGELQLLRWAETSSGGATITFQLSDVKDLEPFKDLTLKKAGMAGQLIAAIMVLVDDAEPIHVPAAVVEPVEHKQRPGELCVMACHFCKDPLFWEWASLGVNVAYRVTDEQYAKLYILEQCGIESRKELDTSANAAKHFHERIRAPFLAWKAQQ